MAEYDGSFKLGVELDTTQAKKDLDNFVKDASKQTSTTKQDKSTPLVDVKSNEKALDTVLDKIDKVEHDIVDSAKDTAKTVGIEFNKEIEKVIDVDIMGDTSKWIKPDKKEMAKITNALITTEGLTAQDFTMEGMLEALSDETYIQNMQKLDDKINKVSTDILKVQNASAKMAETYELQMMKSGLSIDKQKAKIEQLVEAREMLVKSVETEAYIEQQKYDEILQKYNEVQDRIKKRQEQGKPIGSLESELKLIEDNLKSQAVRVKNSRSDVNGIYQSAEYEDLTNAINNENKALQLMQLTQDKQTDNFMRNMELQKRKEEELHKKRQEYVDEQTELTNQQLAQPKIEEGSEESVDKLNVDMDQLISSLLQARSASGALSTILTALPEPLTTALGIVMKLVGAFGVLEVVLNPIKKILKTITGQLAKINKSLLGGGNLLEKIFKSLGQRIKNALFYNTFSKVINGIKQELSGLLKEDSAVKKSLGQIKGNLWTAFAPIYTFVLPAIQRLLQAMVQLSAMFSKLTSGIFGKTTKQSSALAQSLEKQAKAGRGASKSLASFDELNNLSSNGNEIEPLYDGLEVGGKFQEILERVQNILSKIWRPFKDSWDKYGAPTWDKIKGIFDKIVDLVLTIGEDFAFVWDDLGYGDSILDHVWQIVGNILDTVDALLTNFRIAWDEYGRDILEKILKLADNILVHIQNITEMIKDWATDLDFGPLLRGLDKLLDALLPFSDKIGEGLEWFFENILLPLGKWLIEKAIPKVLELVAEGIKFISAKMEEFQNIFEPIWENDLKPLVEKVGDLLIDLIVDITDCLSKMTDKTDTSGKKMDLLKVIVEETVYILEKFLEVTGTVLTILDFLVTGVSKCMDEFSSWKDLLGGMWTGFIQGLRDALDWLQQLIDGFGTLEGLLPNGFNLIDPLGGVRSKIEQSLGLVEVASTTTRSTGSSSRSTTTIPSTPKLTGASAGSIPSNIQQLMKKKGLAFASGTVVPPGISPFLAMLGDNKQETEVVSPLSTMKEAMLQAINESGFGSNGVFHIHVDVDGREIANTMVQQNDIYRRRTGRSLLV